MPKGANILSVHEQNGDIYVWADGDPVEKTEQKRFEIFGTGWELREDMGIDRKFLGTVKLDNGTYVFHVYERMN